MKKSAATARELRSKLEAETLAFSEAIAAARVANANADHLRRELVTANAKLEREGYSDLIVAGLIEPETIVPKITVTSLSKRGREMDDVLRTLTSGRRRLKLVARRSFLFGQARMEA